MSAANESSSDNSFLNNKKILILGAGSNQVPIIRKSKELGLLTIVVSIEGDYPGFTEAHKSYKIDILDVYNIIKIAKLENIDAVISDQLDPAVPVVAEIAEALGLNGIGTKCAESFTNKSLQKIIAEECNIPVPKWYLINNIDDAMNIAKDIGFPLIIKPTDSYGSKGVFVVNCKKELLESFDISMGHSLQNKVLIEEFIEGEQFSSRGLVTDYRPIIFAFSNRYYYKNKKLCLPNITCYPAIAEQELIERMKSYHEQLILRIKPKFGSTGAEWIYDKNKNKLYLIEASIRGGGAYINSDLIPQAYGIDMDSFLVLNSLGMKGDISELDDIIDKKASAYVTFLLPQGEVKSISGLDKIFNVDGFYKSFIRDIKEGDIIQTFLHKGSREGPILLVSNNRAELDKAIKEIQETIKIVIKTPNGDKGVIWE